MVCLLILICTPCLADSGWETTVIPDHDLATNPLFLEKPWDGGILRVTLTASDHLPRDWRIHLDYGDAGVMELDPIMAKSRIVATPQPDRVSLDLPVVGEHTLTVVVRPSTLQLFVDVVFYYSRVNAQQMIGTTQKIDLFDHDVGSKERTRGLGFGRLDLFGERGALLGSCTAFRVARGYWLTAAHCVALDPDHSDRQAAGSFRIEPSDYACRQPTDHACRLDSAPLLAAPIITGQVSGHPNLHAVLNNANELDYAILVAHDDPGGPEFPLIAKAIPPSNTQLELFQHWMGTFGPPAGKARSADDSCVVFQPIGNGDRTRPELCGDAIQHGCSSQEGGSGGPLVLRSDLSLVGVHYRGGLATKYNCALPTSIIIKDICSKGVNALRGVVPCD